MGDATANTSCYHCFGTGSYGGVMGGPNHPRCGYCGGSGKAIDKPAIDLHGYPSIMAQQAAEISSLRSKLDEAREALEPFADVDGDGDEDFPDDAPVVIKFGRTIFYPIKLGDFRRARRALASLEGREQGQSK